MLAVKVQRKNRDTTVCLSSFTVSPLYSLGSLIREHWQVYYYTVTCSKKKRSNSTYFIETNPRNSPNYISVNEHQGLLLWRKKKQKHLNRSFLWTEQLFSVKCNCCLWFRLSGDQQKEGGKKTETHQQKQSQPNPVWRKSTGSSFN